MHTKKIILTIATLLAGTIGASAQNAISFCGGDVYGPGNSSLSNTCGEVAVKRADARSITVVDVTQYFTEGVQQAFFTKELSITSPLQVELSIYPNPTDKGIMMQYSEGVDNLVFEVFDQAGQSITTGTYTGGTQYFDMSSYSTGAYLFRVSTPDKKKSSIYKIIKTN